MPDHRKHRGPHPEDQRLFAADRLPDLLMAMRDLSWLLNRGYSPTSALKLVGDRFSLDARQRSAVARCACADEDVARRRRHQVPTSQLRDQELWIDAYNVLTSIEAALSGGVILHARDGCYRDMASMHGSYRKVDETLPAITVLGQILSDAQAGECLWLLDQPVSNSGRLRATLLEVSERHGWNWRAELVADPDPILSEAEQIVATADSQILNRVERWLNLARVAIDASVEDAWILNLSS